MVCAECSTPLKGRQKRYCSHACARRGNGKQNGGWNRAKQSVTCENCGETFEVSPSRVGTARVCSRQCLWDVLSREHKGRWADEAHPRWNGGRQAYRKHRKDACEQCGTTYGRLLVHHKNTDRSDNRLQNLETLCPSCHQLTHAELRARPSEDQENTMTANRALRRQGERGYHGRMRKLRLRVQREVPQARLVYCPDPAPADALKDGARPGFWHLSLPGELLPLVSPAGFPADPGPWVIPLAQKRIDQAA